MIHPSTPSVSSTATAFDTLTDRQQTVLLTAAGGEVGGAARHALSPMRFVPVTEVTAALAKLPESRSAARRRKTLGRASYSDPASGVRRTVEAIRRNPTLADSVQYVSFASETHQSDNPASEQPDVVEIRGPLIGVLAVLSNQHCCSWLGFAPSSGAASLLHHLAAVLPDREIAVDPKQRKPLMPLLELIWSLQSETQSPAVAAALGVVADHLVPPDHD